MDVLIGCAVRDVIMCFFGSVAPCKSGAALAYNVRVKFKRGNVATSWRNVHEDVMSQLNANSKP